MEKRTIKGAKNQNRYQRRRGSSSSSSSYKPPEKPKVLHLERRRGQNRVLSLSDEKMEKEVQVTGI